MHHTVHMFYKLDCQFYSALFKVLNKLSKSNGSKFYLDKKDDTYKCELFREKGITIILRQVVQDDGISYSAVEIIMNPMRLLNNNDYFQLAAMKHCKAIYTAFNQIFAPIKKKFESDKRNRYLKFRLHRLDSYGLKRVDFSVKLFLLYKESSKRFVQPDHSFYIFRKRNSNSKVEPSLTINCYDKGKQIEENNLPCDDERAKHTIRFEVQCRYSKVYRISKDKGLEKQNYSQFLREDISDEILNHYFKKTIGYGDYYTLTKAKEIIQNKRVNHETKKRLLETLEVVNHKRGIWKAKKCVPDKKEFDKRIKKLHELGVNPVTIPVAWGMEYLPCLFDLVGSERNSD